MKKRYISILMFVLLVFNLSSGLYAAESDPFDLSQYEDNIAEVGVPTQSSIREIKEKAIQAYNNDQDEEAIDLLDKWARSANWMANLVSSGLEPYYSASYDSRKEFSYSKISMLSSYESLSNELKQQRNQAMVMKAELLVRTGQEDKAVALYTKTLDLIHIDNWELWTRALNGLYNLIEVDPITN